MPIGVMAPHGLLLVPVAPDNWLVMFFQMTGVAGSGTSTNKSSLTSCLWTFTLLALSLCRGAAPEDVFFAIGLDAGAQSELTLGGCTLRVCAFPTDGGGSLGGGGGGPVSGGGGGPVGGVGGGGGPVGGVGAGGGRVGGIGAGGGHMGGAGAGGGPVGGAGAGGGPLGGGGGAKSSPLVLPGDNREYSV